MSIIEESLIIDVSKPLINDTNKHVESVLKMVSEDRRIKHYSVIQEEHFEELKKKVDGIINDNPYIELAAPPKLIGVIIPLYVAVLVECE